MDRLAKHTVFFRSMSSKPVLWYFVSVLCSFPSHLILFKFLFMVNAARSFLSHKSQTHSCTNPLCIIFLHCPWTFVHEHLFRPEKNILCFGQPDSTYRNLPTLDFFLRKCPFFFVWVFKTVFYENALFFRWGL